jgi:hypothetical protein
MPLSARAARRLACLASLLLAAACGGGLDEAEGDLGYAASDDVGELRAAVGDWRGFPDGLECLAAVQVFYPARFGVELPLAGPGRTGACASHGACHLWVDRIPDPAVWERIPNDGRRVPTTYDVIVYPPHAGDPWGHIAAVDHVNGRSIYVMDDNYVGHHQRSAAPHTVSVEAYGWYHLKKLGPSGGNGGGNGGGTSHCVEGGLYCGGDKLSGAHDTLYECRSGAPSKVRACGHGCAVRSGHDDGCRCVPGSSYCGGDVVEGEGDTLYRCLGDGVSTAVEKKCARGCRVNPGNDDACR